VGDAEAMVAICGYFLLNQLTIGTGGTKQ